MNKSAVNKTNDTLQSNMNEASGQDECPKKGMVFMVFFLSCAGPAEAGME